MAGGEGFEPPLAESESAVLPLDDPPVAGPARPSYPDSEEWRSASREKPAWDFGQGPNDSGVRNYSTRIKVKRAIPSSNDRRENLNGSRRERHSEP